MAARQCELSGCLLKIDGSRHKTRLKGENYNAKCNHRLFKSAGCAKNPNRFDGKWVYGERCGSAAQALARASQQEEGGVVVSGFRFPDMTAITMASMLPPSYTVLLLLTPSQSDVRSSTRLPCVDLPVNKEELVSQLRRVMDAHRHKTAERPTREERKPVEKSEEARALIAKAKEVLMERDHLSEAQAHRYIQYS